MMASYEGLRKLTLGDKPVIIKFKFAGTNLRVPISQVPTFNELCFIVQRLFRSELSTDLDNLVFRYEDEDGDLITVLDDADISHAISLSTVLKLTVNDKITHPVVTPLEHLPRKLEGMNERQTVAAVTAALVDLQDRIGEVLKVIQSQHPGAVNGLPTLSTISNAASGTGGQQPKAGSRVAAEVPFKAADSKPFVLSAESLDQLLEPRRDSLLPNASSVSSPVANHGGQRPPLSSTGNQLQHQQVQAQQQTPSQSWTSQSTSISNALQPSLSSPATSGVVLAQTPSQQQQSQQQTPQNQVQQQHQQQYAPYANGALPQQQQSQLQLQQIQPQPQQQVQGQGQGQTQGQTPQQPLPQQQQQQQQHQQQFIPHNQSYQQPQQQSQGLVQQGAAQPVQGQAYIQQQQPLQQQQQPQTPFMQAGYAPSPFVQHQQQQYPNQTPYSPATTTGSTPFARSNSVYVPQQQQQQQQQQQLQHQQQHR